MTLIVSKPRILLFLGLFSVVPVAEAPARQTEPARLLTMEDALRLAEARSEEMAIARAGVDRAGAEQVRARSELFPQLSASASYDRALASEFSGIFDNEAPDNGFGDLEELPFGRKNTYRLNFSFSQNLYTGGRVDALTAVANATRRTAEITLASTRAQLMLDVVRAYYDAALAERLMQIAEATYKQADATFEQTRLAFEAGSQPEFELLRAQVTRDNQRPAIIRRRAERDIALLRLKQLLELPPGEQIALAVSPDADALGPPAAFAAGVSTGAEGAPPDVARAPVRQAETVVRQSEGSVSLARSQRWPNVSVTSSYGEVAYPSGALPNDFRRNWTVGVIAQVPILTGGRLRAEEAIARADVLIAEARLQQTRELAQLDTQSAYEELRAAQAAWEASAGTVQQADRAYQIAELRYREGVSTQLELSDARLLLVQAQATRAQAARDLQVARARVALLPDLPLASPGMIAPPAVPDAAPQEQRPRPAPTAPVVRTSGGSTGPGGRP